MSPISDPQRERLIGELIQAGHVSWALLANLAGRYFVTPTLRAGLNRKRLADRVPDDFWQFVDAVFQANLERNRALKVQADSVIRLLNSAGIEPVVMKGAARLLSGTDEDLGSRMMGDIDLLIHHDYLKLAYDVLFLNGYSPQLPESDYADCQHLAPLIHPNWRAPVEVHRKLYGNGEPAWVETEELWNDSTPVGGDGNRFRLLSPHHAIAYNIFHSEVHHCRWAMHSLGLRDLLDFTEASLRRGEYVDWTYMRRVFSSHGLKRVMDAYLYKADRLFGLPRPPGRKANWAARRHFKRSLATKQWEEMNMAQKAIQNLRLIFSAQRICCRFKCSNRFSDLAWHRLIYGTHLVRKYLFGRRRSILINLLSGSGEERAKMMTDYDAKHRHVT